MPESDSDNMSDDYEMVVMWSAGKRKSRTKCVCKSEWRCRCQVKLTPVEK